MLLTFYYCRSLGHRPFGAAEPLTTIIKSLFLARASMNFGDSAIEPLATITKNLCLFLAIGLRLLSFASRSVFKLTVLALGLALGLVLALAILLSVRFGCLQFFLQQRCRYKLQELLQDIQLPIRIARPVLILQGPFLLG